MIINIKGTNIELTDALRSYIMEKFGGIGRFFSDASPDSIIADIEIGKPSQHHRKGEVFVCEITLQIEGMVLRAEEARESVHDAIDTVKDEIERQVRKHKAKRRDQFLRRARKGARGMKLFRWFKREE